LGYRIVHVSNATEALRTAQEYGRRIDLVIGSMRFTSKSGSYLLDELRASRPDLPALLISGFSPDNTATASLSAHTAFLAKPFAMADLVGLVRQLLDEDAA